MKDSIAFTAIPLIFLGTVLGIILSREVIFNQEINKDYPLINQPPAPVEQPSQFDAKTVSTSKSGEYEIVEIDGKQFLIVSNSRGFGITRFDDTETSR